MSYDYDLFTIGAGSGGVRASRMAAAKGAKVAIAEDRFFGGTCVNVGCVPKKMMVYGASYGRALKEAEGYGWTQGGAEPPQHDWSRLATGQRTEVQRLNRVYNDLLQGAGCDVLWGRGRIVDPHTVEVAGKEGVQRFSAKHILIATGGTAVRPELPGAELGWISDDVFTAEEKPERLLVVGGGYIAVEMASIFAGLGSEVTLVHRGAHPLRGFDDDTRAFLCQELHKKGVNLALNRSVSSISRTDSGTLRVMLSRQVEHEVDAVLFAIGRSPNTAGLGLEGLGVETTDRGAIVIDDQFRTSVPSVYALGDVVGRMSLTPVALAEGMALANGLFGDGFVSVSYAHIPTAVFTSPPLASVGLTEAQARQTHGEVHVYSTEFKPLKHALSGSQERTFMKMLVDPASDKVLGVHIVGADAAEMIQAVAVALKAGATKTHFDSTIGLHPTSAEELVTMRERQPDE